MVVVVVVVAGGAVVVVVVVEVEVVLVVVVASGSPSSANANGAVVTMSNNTTLIASDLRTIFNPLRLHQDDCTGQLTCPGLFRPGRFVRLVALANLHNGLSAMGRAEAPVGRVGRQVPNHLGQEVSVLQSPWREAQPRGM